jgi:hypothetical protein
MINSGPATDDAEAVKSQDAAVSGILRSGAKGAIVLAAIAAVIVIAIWFAFYLLVFVPRGGAA